MYVTQPDPTERSSRQESERDVLDHERRVQLSREFAARLRQVAIDHSLRRARQIETQLEAGMATLTRRQLDHALATNADHSATANERDERAGDPGLEATSGDQLSSCEPASATAQRTGEPHRHDRAADLTPADQGALTAQSTHLVPSASASGSASPPPTVIRATSFSAEVIDQFVGAGRFDQTAGGESRLQVHFTLPHTMPFVLDVESRGPRQVALRFRGNDVPLCAHDIDRIITRLHRQGVRVTELTHGPRLGGVP